MKVPTLRRSVRLNAAIRIDFSPEFAAVARFIAPPGFAPHLREAYQRAVNAHPAAWRCEPAAGEVFKDLAEALRCCSLVAGFDIVRSSGNKGFVLTAKPPLVHDGHDLTETLLAAFQWHLADTHERKEILETARHHRLAVVPYSASRRVRAIGLYHPLQT